MSVVHVSRDTHLSLSPIELHNIERALAHATGDRSGAPFDDGACRRIADRIDRYLARVPADEYVARRLRRG